MPADLSRVIVIGTSCCGKTTFASRLSNLLGHPHIEMDVLHWMANWVERPLEEFASKMETAVAGDKWVVDGNYTRIREITTTWPRATAVVWLNYNFLTVMSRALKRKVPTHPYWRGAFRKSGALLRGLSVVTWNCVVVLRTYRRRKLQYAAMRDSGQYPSLEWIEFRRPAEAERFLGQLDAAQRGRPPSIG